MPKRILLVDDDLDDQLFIHAAIAEVAADDICTVANNGSEAMQYVEASKYDVILIDLNMPLMNGFEALKKIKMLTQYKDVPVFILSSSSDKYEIARCKRFGAADYIVKPHSFSVLVDKLKNIFSQIESCQHK